MRNRRHKPAWVNNCLEKRTSHLVWSPRQASGKRQNNRPTMGGWQCQTSHMSRASNTTVITDIFSHLRPTTEEVYAIARDVCLSVCAQDYSKTRAWIWMKCCVSTGVGTRTNWLTFEPDPDHSPDAGTGFLSPIAHALQRGNVEFYYVAKIPSTYWYWGPV